MSRSAEEREAARLERERRRALSRGETPPASPAEPAAADAWQAVEPVPAADAPTKQGAAPSTHGAALSTQDVAPAESPAPVAQDVAQPTQGAAPVAQDVAPPTQPPAPPTPQASSPTQDVEAPTPQAAPPTPQAAPPTHGAVHGPPPPEPPTPQAASPTGEPAPPPQPPASPAQPPALPPQQHATAPPAPPPEADGAWSWEAPPEPEPAPEPPRPPMRSFPSAPPADWHPDDAPIGTIGAPQPGAPGMSPYRPVTVPRRRRRRGRLLLIVPPVLLVAALLYLLIGVFTPFKGEGSGEVVVQIPQGASTREIGDLLADRGVVGSGAFFVLRARLGDDDLRAGRFTLARGMGNAEAIDALTRAPAAPKVIRLTLPEGPSRREQAPLVAKAGIDGDYLKASERSPLLDPRDYGAPRGTPLEGFLFPATYELPAGASAARLVREQVRAFKENLATVDLTRARRKNLTRYDVLIIASMIERETALPRERRLVAAVIYNRLKDGIPLGIDATTRYAEGNWTRPLRQSELNRDSPYNTRRNRGLPPTPIGNPGLASIKAAARPTRSGALFYVVKPCGNGAHNFSRTAAEFERDVAAYETKRRELGGKDPSQCG